MSHVDEGTLHAYLDGSLPAGSERRALEVHLISCASCRNALEEVRSLRTRSAEILDKAGPEPAVTPPPFEEIVARAEARSSGRATRRLSRMRALAWAATIVLAAGVGSVVTLQLRAPVEAPTSTPVAASEGTSNEREAERSAAVEPRARVFADRGDQPLPGAMPDKAADEFAAPAAGERNEAAADMALASNAEASPGGEPEPAAAELKAVISDSVGPAQARTTETLALRNRSAQPTEADTAGSLEAVGRLEAARAPGQPPAPPDAVAARGLLQERQARDSAPPREAGPATLTVMADDRGVVSWREVTASEAAQALGGSVAVVDGLPILGYAARTLDGRAAVRVLQRTEAGVELEIIQWEAVSGGLAVDSLQVSADRTSPRDSVTTLSVQRGAYNLRVRANVPQETLQTLLERIRPE